MQVYKSQKNVPNILRTASLRFQSSNLILSGKYVSFCINLVDFRKLTMKIVLNLPLDSSASRKQDVSTAIKINTKKKQLFCDRKTLQISESGQGGGKCSNTSRNIEEKGMI